jgi:uncharacterized protein DUF6519
MGGDYSRLRFDRRKHYAGVLLQQGRALLDSDWNEAEAIRAHLWRTFVRDVLGSCAFPVDDDGKAGFALTTDGDKVTIGAGHAWIDGLLCEIEAEVNAEAQPDLPGASLPTEAGRFVAYLDVWQREVTAAEDPSIREPALGGPDTTIRLATVWQVRWRRAPNDADSHPDEAGGAHLSPDTTDARLAARGQYVGLENQLYRVEIHEGGRPRTATIKWSRDNGSTVAALRSWTARELQLEPNQGLRFRAGDRLEVVDRVAALDRRPGPFIDVGAVVGDRIRLASTSPNVPTKLIKPIVRRWEAPPIALSDRAQGAWLSLDDGVEVRLYGRQFRTGDYWNFPVRTASLDGPGTLEWPVRIGKPEPLAPHGIAHHRCPLALLDHDDHGWRVIRDLRPKVG